MGLSPQQWWRLGLGGRTRALGGTGATRALADQPAPLKDLGVPSRRQPRLHRARCDPAAGHSPSGSPGARPQPGGKAAVSSSSSSGSSARAAPGQPRPATPMEGTAAAGRGDGARASTAEAPGGVYGRPARRALTPPARPRLAPEPRPHFHTVLPGRGGLCGGSAAPTGPPSFPLRPRAQGARPWWPEGGCQPGGAGPKSPARDLAPNPLPPAPRPTPALREPCALPVYSALQLDPVPFVDTNWASSLKYSATGHPGSVMCSSGVSVPKPQSHLQAVHLGRGSVVEWRMIPHTSDPQKNSVKRVTPASLLTSAHPLHPSPFCPPHSPWRAVGHLSHHGPH